MRRRTISVFLSLMLCLSLLSACGTTTDVPINGSNRDIAFEETQQEESAEGSDSTTSENGESASDPESGKDDSVSDKAQPSQPEQNANENSLSAEAPAFSLSSIAEYTDKPYVAVNGNVPYFTESELTDQSYEYYSDLDALGRCGTACASIGQDLMPTESRGSIGMVKPTGWHTVRYDDLVDGKYLYNRCHLIGFQLTGENANTKNLITGTRYLNIEGMLPFENMVADYVKENGNHVMYRVTPIFEGDNLLANGVLMEGYSVEDKGAGICYCVYAYNVQPGVEIDYATGDSRRADSSNTAQTPSTVEPALAQEPDDSASPSNPSTRNDTAQADYILNANTKKFHYPTCSSVKDMKDENKQEFHGTRNEVIAIGYSPCGRCKP